VSPLQKSSWVLEDGLEIEVGNNGKKKKKNLKLPGHPFIG
jgi:hypothetical protein